MSQTITKTFDPKSDLPKWAQKYPQVVSRAESNYAFRCNCWTYAKSKQWQAILIKEASK